MTRGGKNYFVMIIQDIPKNT